MSGLLIAPTIQAMTDFRQEFIAFCIDCGVLRFGSFVTKSGRETPYFFNAGLFNTGARLDRLAEFYASAILDSGVTFDMLFGPAYKGIALATGAAMALARRGRDVPFAFNRKEAKDHGEGGTLVGAPVQGRVLIIDDVISAGTSVRESINLITSAGATPCGVTIALDRQEKATENGQDAEHSAVQDVERRFGLPVVAIATLGDLLQYLNAQSDSGLAEHRQRVLAYRERYGV